MNQQAQHIYSLICKAVETDQLKLPTLPEVALKVKSAVESEDQTAADIADLLIQDSALSARLLQLANSPLYRARHKIDNLQTAISRLGLRIVKDLVIMLAIKQAFKASDAKVDQQFRAIWQCSIDVASVSRVLSQSQGSLESEQAIVAGLIHNIGSLPLIELAERQPQLFEDLPLADAIPMLQSELGKKILSFWGFPQMLVNVASEWNQYEREHAGDADYVDLVQVAVLHTEHRPSNTPEDLTHIQAFGKLGLDPEVLEFDSDTQSQLDETRESLMQI